MISGGQNGKDDDTAIILVVCVFLMAVVFFAARYFQAEINYYVLRIKYYETFIYSFWSDSWKEFTDEMLADSEALAKITTPSLAAFYNRYASIAWLFIYAPIAWYLWKLPTKNDHKHQRNPQTLLEVTSKIVSATFPWVHRDITKRNWNFGVWRLMESPLLFLIRNKAIKDPKGEPFHYNQVFDCGENPQLYSVDSEDEEKEPDYFKDSSFDNAVKLADKHLGVKAGENDDNFFELAPRQLGTTAQEIDKFKKSDLVPILDCRYLNSKKRKVKNELDEIMLYNALVKQLGGVIGKFDRKSGNPDPNGIRDPFLYLKHEAKLDKKNLWRFGLAAALYLHGYSDQNKKEAYQIFDAMNYSFSGSDALDPEKINIGPAAGDKISLKFEDDRVFRESVMKHCYFTNVFFMGLLGYARRRGVIEIAKFSWVRCFDRSLWYTLVQTGRSVACAEAAGVWSHYFAEEAKGEPMDDPYMHIAIEGFRAEMRIEGYLNNEFEEERLKNKKKEIENARESKQRVKDNGYE